MGRFCQPSGILAGVSFPILKPTRDWRSVWPGHGEARLRDNLLFYLSTSPSQFEVIVAELDRSGLLRKEGREDSWQRIVWEKPFGHDLASARNLNLELMRHAHEKQLFRIDHYLGKETVQNILMFRFSNAIFEPIWHRGAVDHVQITVSENAGMGNRGGYYEETGALRDMVQNHLLQVLALMAMEPPVSLEAEAIRRREGQAHDLPPAGSAQPGQSAGGARAVSKRGDRGQPRAGYREEAKVNAGSNVETYVAFKVYIDNWRWSQVPFYLRTGKSLPLSASEIRVQFRPTPNVLFAAQCGPKLDANAITIRLQPNEGISSGSTVKSPEPVFNCVRCACTSVTTLSRRLYTGGL